MEKRIKIVRDDVPRNEAGNFVVPMSEELMLAFEAEASAENVPVNDLINLYSALAVAEMAKGQGAELSDSFYAKFDALAEKLGRPEIIKTIRAEKLKPQ